MDPEQHPQEEYEMQEEIQRMQEQQPNFDLDIEFQASASYNVSGSKVVFPQKGIVIRKDGASTGDMEIYINPAFIKVGPNIGKGTAGQVYLADYTQNEQTVKVAIKQIPLNAQKQVRDQFFNDLKVFLRADNENLVKFYGCYYQKGYLHEVIEYMDLGSLRDLISYFMKKKMLLIQPLLAHFSKCILLGLKAIHCLKQIHRDIKPENILVNSKGQIKITDFGVSKTFDKTIGLAKTSIGTIVYMSPERMTQNGHTYNCDVWSFGLVLFQLATLRVPPFLQQQNESEYDLLKRVQKGEAPHFLPEDNRSGELHNFLSRCLQKDFHQRANVQDLLNHNWMNSQLQQLSEKQFKQYLRVLTKQIKAMAKQSIN